MATLVEPTQTLDIKGMRCPMPLVWARNMMQSLQPGEVLEILATDPDSIENFKSFSRMSGHEMLDWSESAGLIRILIRKADGAKTAP